VTPIVSTAAILENPRLSDLHGQAKPSFAFVMERISRRSVIGCAFHKGDQATIHGSHPRPFQSRVTTDFHIAHRAGPPRIGSV
jgi:hypothetical protein